MTTSDAGRRMIEGFEGCRLKAYLDQRGIPTIGYGHTQGVKMGDACTFVQADQWLTEDLTTRVEDPLARLLPEGLSQNQYDAAASFTFNEGEGHLAGSTLLKLIISGDMLGAANQFLAWDKVQINGVLTADDGLLRRRKAERAVFLTP